MIVVLKARTKDLLVGLSPVSSRGIALRDDFFQIFFNLLVVWSRERKGETIDHVLVDKLKSFTVNNCEPLNSIECIPTQITRQYTS